MSKKRYPDIIGIGTGLLSAHTTIPGWWKTRDYEAMRREWSHATLLRSVQADIANGETVPADVLAHFKEL